MSEIRFDHIAIAAHRVADAPAPRADELASARPVSLPDTCHPPPGTALGRRAP